jgi:hypothetical protein
MRGAPDHFSRRLQVSRGPSPRLEYQLLTEEPSLRLLSQSLDDEKVPHFTSSTLSLHRLSPSHTATMFLAMSSMLIAGMSPSSSLASDYESTCRKHAELTPQEINTTEKTVPISKEKQVEGDGYSHKNWPFASKDDLAQAPNVFQRPL